MKTKTTTLLVSHDLEEAVQLAKPRPASDSAADTSSRLRGG